MRLFEDAFQRALIQEGIKNGKIYVYHMTKRDALKGGILKSGWERFYSGRNSNAYGPGVYTTLYPSADSRSKSDPYDTRTDKYGDKVMNRHATNLDRSYRSSIYGDIMLKCLLPSLKGFVAFDKQMSRYIFGIPTYFKRHANQPSARNYYDVDEQLYILLGKRLYNEIKDTDDFKAAAYDRDRFVSAYKSARALDRLCQFYPEVNERINGFVTHSNADGYVVIVRDFYSLRPVEYSENYGKTWKPLKLEADFDEYNKGNVDLRRKLGLDNVTQYNNQTNMAVNSPNQLPAGWQSLYDRYNHERLMQLVNKKKPYDYVPPFMYGDFARVMKDGKYNYFYKGTLDTRKPISNVWFDEASESWSKDGFARVKIKGNVYLLGHNGKNFFLCTPKKEYVCDLDDLNPDTGQPNDYSFDDFDLNW